MGIVNTLSEIAKNKSKFDQYEETQNDTKLQRDELNRRREHTQQEIKAAKELGETIIDVVDIMDQHSEDIAENVETVTEPLIGISPILGFLLSGFLSKEFIGKPSVSRQSKIQEQFVNSEEVKNLVDEIQKAQKQEIPKGLSNEERIKFINNQTKDYIPFSSYSVTRKNEINRLKKVLPELGEKAEVLNKKYKKLIAPELRKVKIAVGIPIFTAIASFVAANIYSTKLQVQSSRVARYQARKVLEDPKYFVKYTPEQIAQAKKILENDPEYKKSKKKLHTDKLKGGIIKGLISIIRDNKEYKNWKKTDKDDSKKVTRELTPEEIKNAIKDKEVIQRVVKNINNQAEVYSENMEVAANVIIGTTPWLGLGIGALVSNIMNRMKIIPNFVNKIVQTYGSEESKAAYAEMIKKGEGKPGYNSARSNFISQFLYIDKLNEKNAKTATELEKNIKQAKKVFATAMTMKKSRQLVFGLIGGTITSLVGSLIALKLQKASSRAGRFIAKREMEQDPKNFIGYTEEDYAEVKDIKAPKPTLSKKIKDYALFLPNVIKNYIDYQKYKRTTMKQEKMLKEELTKTEVTPEQLKDAKNLQRKIFNTFEKVDDKSQEYSESTEAAIEIAQPFVLGMGMLAVASPLLYGGYLAYKGKLNAKSIINKILTLLSTSSKITESKYFKKYLNEIAEQIPYKVQNNTPSSKILSKILNGIDLQKTPLPEIIQKLSKNSYETMKNFSNLSPTEQRQILWDLEKLLPQNSKLKNITQTLQNMSNENRNFVFSAFMNPQTMGKSISKMPKDEYMELKYQLKTLLKENSDTPNLFETVLDLPQDAFGKFVDLLLNKETITNLSKLPKSEFDAHINKITEPMLKHCKENYDLLSASANYGSFGENNLKKIEHYKIIGKLFSAIKLVDQNDFKLVNQFLENRIDFLKNISKINDSDFERIKNYLLSASQMLQIPGEISQKIATSTKTDWQNYTNKFLAITDKIKEAKEIKTEQFEKELLPLIKQQFAELKIEGFENISTKEEFLSAAELLLKNGLNIAKEKKMPEIVTNYLEKNSRRIISNPKNIIDDIKNMKVKDLFEYLESKINAQSDTEINKMLQRLEYNNMAAYKLKTSTMDKAYLLDCINKLKLISEKLPEKEFKTILSSMLKEFNEHPDEFLAYVRTGKILNIYQTPSLQKAALAAGISWTVLNVIITYTIEAILADIQLKAGRLGVMKALDSLDDPAYYANIENITDTDIKPAQPIKAQTDSNSVWSKFFK